MKYVRRIVIAVLNAAIDFHAQQKHEGVGPKNCSNPICSAAVGLYADLKSEEE